MRVGVGLLVTGLVLISSGLMDADVAAQPGRLIRIGALTESWGPTPAIIGLREGLKELGYRENEHFVIGVRFTQGDPAELPAAAQELVRHGVDVIVTSEAGNAAKAAKAATSRIPIVFIGGIDPVELGLVKSDARPGGNVTGVADLGVELIPKRLELCQQLVPGLKRVLLVYDATSDYAFAQLNAFREAARRLGLTLVEKPVRSQDEAQAVIAGVRRQQVDGILGPRSLSLNIPLRSGSRDQASDSDDVPDGVLRGAGWAGWLRAQHAGLGRPGGAPGGQDPQGSQPRDPSRRAAHQV